MKPADALDALRDRLDRAGPDATVAARFAVMRAFYREVRVEDCPLEDDGDMLLFQWGTVRAADTHRFEIDLTRQLIAIGDEEPLQLHLTAQLAPTAALTALGAGQEWCPTPADLDAFAALIEGTPAYAATAAVAPQAWAVGAERC